MVHGSKLDVPTKKKAKKKKHKDQKSKKKICQKVFL